MTRLAVVEAVAVHERDGGDYHEGGDGTGDEAENENGPFHWLLPNGRLRLRDFNADGGGIVVILLSDFGGCGEKSCFSANGQGMRRSSLPNWTAWVRRLAPNLSKTRPE
jgi:hypothetical protein